MPTITASDGCRLYYAIDGEGPADVILLHGMGGAGFVWEPLRAELDRNVFRVITLDLRGHGQSQGGPESFSYPQLNADILAVADAVGSRAALVVAHSGSCKNAVWLAAAAPLRVRGLALVAPPGVGEVPLPRATLAWLFDHIAREKNFPREFDPWFTEKIGGHRPAVEKAYVRLSREILDASAEMWVHAPVSEQAARVSHPVLVIAGAREPIYHPEFQRQTTLVALPHARLEVLDCAHFIPLEEPRAVAESLSRFNGTLG